MSTTNAVTDASPYPDSIRHRLACWVRGLFPSPPIPPAFGELAAYRRLANPIAVLAQGDAFEFQICVTLVWRSNGVDRETLRNQADSGTAQVLAELRQRAAKLARGYLPHRAGELEDKLNQEPIRCMWTLERGAGAVTCQADVTVLPDERVRESLQPIWQRRVTMESEHDLALRRADLVRQLTEAWTATIEKLQNNPLTAHAAQLTEDRFGDVFGNMLATRGEAADKLIGLLQKAISDHQKIGLYEFTEAYDAALKSYEKQAGLASPDLYEYKPPPLDSSPDAEGLPNHPSGPDRE